MTDLTPAQWIVVVGACMCFTGVATLFSRRLAQWGMLSSVLGLTAIGWASLMDALTIFSAVVAALCWGFALMLIVASVAEERRRDAGQEVHEGQVHGEGAEGQGH